MRNARLRHSANLENQKPLVTSRALVFLPHQTGLIPPLHLTQIIRADLAKAKYIDGMSGSIYNALIRTHHITSRKKVAKLRQAAANYNIYALLRYGGCPGIMYCQGTELGVKEWVSTVQRLRYKDFQLVRKPTAKEDTNSRAQEQSIPYGKAEEVDSVKEFGARMADLGVREWWRRGMGYAAEE
jgi:hypothetical protein